MDRQDFHRAAEACARVRAFDRQLALKLYDAISDGRPETEPELKALTNAAEQIIEQKAMAQDEFEVLVQARLNGQTKGQVVAPEYLPVCARLEAKGWLRHVWCDDGELAWVITRQAELACDIAQTTSDYRDSPN